MIAHQFAWCCVVHVVPALKHLSPVVKLTLMYTQVRGLNLCACMHRIKPTVAWLHGSTLFGMVPQLACLTCAELPLLICAPEHAFKLLERGRTVMQHVASEQVPCTLKQHAN